MLLRSRLMSKRLPDNFQEVEYLESTGSQYIDTNLIGTGDLECDITFQCTNPSITYHSILGDRQTMSNNRYTLIIGDANVFALYWTENSFEVYFSRPMTEKGLVHNIVKKDQKLFIDNNFHANCSYQVIQTPNTVLLFNVRTNGVLNTWPLIGRIFHCSFTRNNILIRDFVPAYRITDHKPCMYDLVNMQPYFNSGSGVDFNLGPEVY